MLDMDRRDPNLAIMIDSFIRSDATTVREQADIPKLIAAQSEFAADINAWMMSFCHNYPGPGEEVP